MKKLLSLVVLAGLTFSAVPAFSACTTEKEKADNQQFYTVKGEQECCCKKGETSTYLCDIVTKGTCTPGENTMKLSGPDYCPCEFTKADKT